MAISRNDSLVTYEEAEPFTTRANTMDFSKAGEKKNIILKGS
jgi:hypothetical protein